MDDAKLIYVQIPKVMAAVGAIGKDRKNQQQGYAFRGIDDLYNAVQHALIAHGVFVVPVVTERVRDERPTRDGKGTLFYTTLTVRHTFYAADGSSVEAVTVGEAMDSGDKSSNKAMSAAMKYALIEVLAIPTEGDNDTENKSPEPAARQPARPPAPPANAKPAPQSKPAADAPDLSDNKVFRKTLLAAFGARGFTGPACKAAIVAVQRHHELATLDDLPVGKRRQLVEMVRAGEADKYKPVGQSAAA